MVPPAESSPELEAQLLAEQRKLAAVRELGRALGPNPDHTGRIAGVLQALNRHDRLPFDTDDEALLGAVAAYAGVALENSKLYESLLRQNAELLRAQHDLQQRISELDLLYQIERESA